MNFPQTEVVKSYWADTAYFTNLDKLFLHRSIREPAVNLLEWKDVNVEFTQSVSIKDTFILKIIVGNGLATTGIHADRFIQFLYDNCLNAIQKWDFTLCVKIPNNESFHRIHLRLVVLRREL